MKKKKLKKEIVKLLDKTSIDYWALFPTEESHTLNEFKCKIIDDLQSKCVDDIIKLFR